MPSTGRSPPAPAPHSCAASPAVLVPQFRGRALATRPFLSRLLVVLRGVVRVFFLLCFFPRVPSSLHARTTTLHCHLSGFRSVLLSSPTAILWRGPWRSRPMPGGRPSLATQPFSPRCCTFLFLLSSPPSPPLCLLPALLVLFSCSMCSLLAVPAPWLYLARPHAPSGFCPVFRPVGRPGRPPQAPLRGDSPFVFSRRPPLHQFPDGPAGGGGTAQCRSSAWCFSERDIVFICALVGPLFPPPPAPCLLYVSLPCVRLPCCFFFPCSCSPLLPRALRVPPALLRATPVPLPCAPSLACLPSHSPSRCRPCLYICPPCLSRAVTRVCQTPALPLPLPVAPTLFPGVSPTLVLPRSPSLTPSWLPCALWGGGGMYLRTGLWPCPRTGMAVGFLHTMSHRMCRTNTERTAVRRLSNSLRCICTVEPSRIDQLRTRAPIQTRRGHQGFTVDCTSQVSHGAGGHQGLAWSTSQSRARVSPMVSMQHLLVMQRALPQCNKSADSPHTPAASPQGRH